MNKFLLTLAISLISAQLFPQKAWIEPVEIDPEDSVTIFVDIAQMDCQRLLDTTGPLYMWTWQPADPVVGNGDWTASNPDMEMTLESPNVWSITFIPTEFYDVDAATVYANDFHFLVKALDGTGEGGGGCDEDKTEDLSIEVDPPNAGPVKVASFPDPFEGDTLLMSENDIFTLVYDQRLEEKPSMQNEEELYVYARCVGDDGIEYKVSLLGEVGDNPDLQMTNHGDGTFSFSILPKRLYAEAVPDGIKVAQLRMQITKKVITNSDDSVDGVFNFFLTNDCE